MPAQRQTLPTDDSGGYLDAVHHCDNLDLLATLPDACIDLIYIDPPFNTGITQHGSEAAFADTWSDIADYLDFMKRRLVPMRRTLRATGSILLHCDWRTSHHLRLALDEIFGPDQFVNHLIWRYGLGGSSPRRFARKHDDILFYARSVRQYYFKPPMVPATSRRMRGLMKKATDVLDVPAINNQALERNGYPTQKPLALLKMLLEACCPPGGIVADFFCGSGTTLVAAAETGRHWIGADCSDQAVQIARRRTSQLH